MIDRISASELISKVKRGTRSPEVLDLCDLAEQLLGATELAKPKTPGTAQSAKRKKAVRK